MKRSKNELPVQFVGITSARCRARGVTGRLLLSRSKIEISWWYLVSFSSLSLAVETRFRGLEMQGSKNRAEIRGAWPVRRAAVSTVLY